MEQAVDIVVVGSGFGGAVAASRLVAAGHQVVMLERGPWRDTVPNRSLGIQNLAPLPQGAKAFTHGIRSISSHRFKKALTLNKKGFAEAHFGDGISVVCSSNVGGGSHIYAGLLGKPFDPNYWDGWHPDLTQSGMERFYSEFIASLNARPSTAKDQIPNELADADYNGQLVTLMDEGLPLSMLLPQQPGIPQKVVAPDGLERWECDMRNNSFMGSPSGAKTTLDFSLIWPAMKNGLVVYDLCEAKTIRSLTPQSPSQMRYEVTYQDHHNGEVRRIKAKHLILAAGGLNTVKLLIESRDRDQVLQGMPRLGYGFGGNGDFFGFWKENHKTDLISGLPIVGPFRCKGSTNSSVLVLRSSLQGVDLLPIPKFVKRWLSHQSVIIAFGGDNSNGRMTWDTNGYSVRYSTKENEIYRQIDAEIQDVQKITRTKVYAPSSPVTVHPVGGACVGSSMLDGVIGANGEVFDNPGLYVADAAALPKSPGGPPSLCIAAWAANVAERMVVALRIEQEKSANTQEPQSATS